MAKKESKKALKEFLAEVEELTETLNSDLLRLSEESSTGTVDPDLVNSIFRAAHTIKGLSGMFGFSRMSNLSHNLENVFDSIRLGKIKPNPQISDLLFEGIDIINRFLASKGEKEGEEVEIEGFIKRLNNAVTEDPSPKTLSPFETIDLSENVLNVLTEYEEHRLKENINGGKNLFIINAHFSMETFEEGLTEMNKRLKALGEIIATLPSASGDNNDEICFDILAGTGKDLKTVQEEIKVKEGDIVTINKKKEAPAYVSEEPPPPITPPTTTTPPPTPQAPEPKAPSREDNRSLRSVSNTVRVDIERLDAIMNIVGELLLNRSSIEKIANTIKSEMGFKGLAVDIYKFNNELEKKLYDLRESVLEVRMVPVSQLFDKLARVVKRLSLGAGKEVELITEGAETKLDKLIIEDLADPLLHLIRNTLDHGIETPEVRKDKGKSPGGTINLKAYQKGNHVVIEVKDDGAGIDVEELTDIALEKGFISEEDALKNKKEDILEIIFLPGFSIKKKVSELSGRGVGMDVVKENLSRLSGTIDVETEKDKGTRFTLTLPITLAIIKAIITSVSEKIYAVPITSVLEILSIHRNDIKTIEGQEVIELRGKTLPLLRLGRFFNLSSDATISEKSFVVLVGLVEQRLGLLVDEILGEQDMVIKPLGKGLEGIPGIAGAAEYGGQKTILIVDPGGIIASSIRSAGKGTAPIPNFGVGINGHEQPEAVS